MALVEYYKQTQHGDLYPNPTVCSLPLMNIPQYKFLTENNLSSRGIGDMVIRTLI